MAPSTRNSKVCGSCGVLIVRVGKGEEENSGVGLVRCQKCWGLVELSLEDRIKELTNRNEVEELSFRECCDCDNLRAKVSELEAVVSRERGRECVLDQGEGLESLTAANSSMLVELTELRISKEKLRATVEEYGRKLAIQSEAVRKMEETMKEMREVIKAYKLQVEEYEKGSRGDMVREEGRDREWQQVGNLGRETYAEKVHRTGVRPRFQDQGVGNNERERRERNQSPGVIIVEKTGRERNLREKKEPSEGNGKTKEKIIIIGSSLVRNVDRVVSMKESGSFLKSFGGAGIKQIVSEAVVASKNAVGKTKLFIQGGGNSLKCLGAEETVKSVLEGLREIGRMNKNVWTIVLSLVPRPRENGRYEEERKRTNAMLFDEIVRLASEGLKVTFMDMDRCMNMECFANDRVHFNFQGNKVFGKIIIGIINRKPMVSRSEGQGRN